MTLWRVRVNRNLGNHQWVIHSLDHGIRVGHAEGVLLRDVTFGVENDVGWADGTLVAYSGLVLAPKTAGLPPTEVPGEESGTPWPLRFEKGPPARFERVMVMQMWKGHVARVEVIETVKWMRCLASKTTVSSG